MDFEKRESFLLGKAAGIALCRIAFNNTLKDFYDTIEREEHSIREELSDLYESERATEKLIAENIRKPITQK